VKLDDENLHAFLTAGRVMVTGAGGSIGSNFVRQIINYRPKCLLLVERADFFFSRSDASFGGQGRRVRLADRRRRRSSRECVRIFETYRPEVIFHAAAHKHVPLMEVNAAEAIKNNVLATRSLGTLAGKHGVRDFVLISTDKAVNPTSVMGASKRIAEIVVQG
jgi:FlaA1/EpsC-like NDP-sugar epimerase